MKKYFLILCAFYSISLSAQAPNIHWQKVYGGNGNERLNKIISASDGSYIISGESESGVSGDKTDITFGEFDYWIIKSNSQGVIEWQKDFGGSDTESRPHIIETIDGGFLICGNSQSNISGNKAENTNGFSDFWVIKLDDNGSIQWQNTIGGSFTDIVSSVIQTPDGGYLLGGSSVSNSSGDKTENNVGFQFGLPYYTYYDYWIVKIDVLGNIQWDNTIGSKLNDGVTIAINASDNGYLIGGYTSCDTSGDQSGSCHGDLDSWIVKLDIDGNIIWQNIIGGNNRDLLQTIISTSDGGYLLGLDSNSNISGQKTENSHGGKDYWVIKIDSLGEVSWDKTIGGSLDDIIVDLKEDINNNFYALGYSNSNISGDKTQNSKGAYDYWILKLDQIGNVIWDKTIGGSDNDYNASLQYIANDDSVLIGGSSSSIISGDKSEDTRGLFDYWIVKLESDNLQTNFYEKSNISIYPNPTAKKIFIDFQKIFKKVTVNLINVLGQLILEKKYTNSSKIEFNIDGPKGIYFVNIDNENNERVTFKIVKE